MNVPEEFKVLVGAFYQGSDLMYSTQEEWVDSRLGMLSKTSRAAVVAFLDRSLRNNVNISELQSAWEAGNSCYFFRDRDLLAFLSFIEERLKSMDG